MRREAGGWIVGGRADSTTDGDPFIERVVLCVSLPLHLHLCLVASAVACYVMSWVATTAVVRTMLLFHHLVFGGCPILSLLSIFLRRYHNIGEQLLRVLGELRELEGFLA